MDGRERTDASRPPHNNHIGISALIERGRLRLRPSERLRIAYRLAYSTRKFASLDTSVELSDYDNFVEIIEMILLLKK